MAIKRAVSLLLVITALSCAAAAQDAVESFWEVALSNDYATVEKHLPREFGQAMSECDPTFREKLLAGPRFIIEPDVENLQAYGPQKPGVMRFIDKYDDTPMEARIVSQFVTADTASLALLIAREVRGQENKVERSQIVTMRFLEGSWRLVSIALPEPSGTRNYILDGTLRANCQAANESSAVGNLRSINTGEITYSATFPQTGFAATLTQLGPPATGPTQWEPSPGASGLLDRTLGCPNQPCIKSGYEFRIEAPGTVPRMSYKVYARPITYGKTGARSFFTSEDGLIHFTTEDRDATAKDPVLD